MHLTEEQKIKIKNIGKKYNLKLILLHGSYAKDRQKPGSDLDIAYLGSRSDDLDMYLDIYSELEDIFGCSSKRELDVKSLHKIDPLFCYQVAKYSQLLYGKLQDYNEFRAYAFRIYHDAKDLFRLEKLQVLKYQKYLDKKYA